MLEALRQLLARGGGSPARIAAGLRQAVLAAYLSQVGLLLAAAGLALAHGQPAGGGPGRAPAFLAVSAVAAILIWVAVERSVLARPALESALRAAAMLAVAAVIPAALALVLAVVEGPGAGSAWLGLTSLGALLGGLAAAGRHARLVRPGSGVGGEAGGDPLERLEV